MIFKKKNKKHKNNDIIEEGIEIVDQSIKNIKKKIGLFYKIHFFLASIITLILFYFLVLVPIKPFSVPFFTHKINQYLQNNIDETTKISDAKISFTSYGTLKLLINDFTSAKIDQENDNREIKIPEIEAEFSLFKFLYLNYAPINLKINDLSILILEEKKENEDSLKFDKDFYIKKIKLLTSSLISLQSKKDYAKNIIFNNALISIKQNDKQFDFHIKKSNIKIFSRDFHNFYFTTNSIILVNNEKDSLVFQNNCQFDRNESLKCDFEVENLNISSFAEFCESCEVLKNINSKTQASLSFLIQNKVEYFNFNVKSDIGDFFLPKFFENKISYKNLEILGNYDFKNDTLSINQIKSKLQSTSKKIAKKDNDKSQTLVAENSEIDFFMSYLIQNFSKKINDSKLFIEVKNLQAFDIADFWPVNLPKQEIRKWVFEHIKEGFIDEAFVNIGFEQDNLKNLDAKVNFQDLEIDYFEKLPVVKNAFGVASFTKNDMNISIAKAKTLESEILNSKVVIPDFTKPQLEIFANVVGNAADGLKHINHSSKKFGEEVEKYLNGESVSKVLVKIPLYKNINLKNVFIEINSDVQNANSEYFNGKILIHTKKNYLSNKFKSIINFNETYLDLKELSISKNKNEISSLKFIVDVSNDKELLIDKIFLSSSRKNQFLIGKIKFLYDKQKFNYVNLQNYFGRNNYKFKLIDNSKESRITLTGSRLDLSRLLMKNQDLPKTQFIIPNISVYSSISKIYLANKKVLRNFKANFSCENQICYRGYVNSILQNSVAAIDFKIQNYLISGKVFNIGYILEGLNISNKISGGIAKINVEQSFKNSKATYLGNVKIKNELIFYENNLTKKLDKDDLYSKVKDKIFSNNKTVFNNIEIDFVLSENIFEIKSLIANNFKIGITAKGIFDLAKNSYEIKGMIIPGFIINNLFGVGKIPILGNIVSGLLTGGEGGGIFGIKYEYVKLENQKEAEFKTFAVSAFVPVSIRNLFERL